MNKRSILAHLLSSSTRVFSKRIETTCYFYHQSSSFDSFNKIKKLYNEGKQVDAIHEYFKNPSPFAASFLIARQNKIDMALKIYQTAKNNSSLDSLVIMTFMSALEKNNEHHMMTETVLDDLMNEIQRLQGKDIAKIKATNWGSIIKSLCQKRRKKDVESLMDIIQKHCIELGNWIYTLILRTCVNEGWIELGKRIHTYIEQKGKMDIILKCCLINLYGKCRYLDEAVKIFNNIKVSERDVITWTTMILAYGEHGKGREASILYEEMQKEGMKPNDKTISCVSKACCESNLIDNAAEILFSIENKLGIKPDVYHYNYLLTACADKGLIDLGKKIHKHIIENNYPQNVILKTNLINMYGKCGCLEEAIEIFNSIKISERNIITWTTMILAYGEHGKGKEASDLFWNMKEEKIKPDNTIVTCILKACCESNMIDNATEIFFSMENKLGIKPNEYHYNCMLNACAENGLLSLGKKVHKHIIESKHIEGTVLKTNIVNMYGKCGCSEEAIEIFNNIKICDRDTFTWSTMISVYGQHGKGKEALGLFEQMQHEGLLPDETTVTCVSNACSHSGLVQEALDIFHNLENKFKIKINVFHCACIVDVLGRAGRLEDTETFITNYMKEQQIKPDVATWMTLLAACRIYKDIERAEKAAQYIMDLDPKNASVYVLLSNIYAQSGNTNKAEELRLLMDAKGIKKIPGVSTVDVKGKVYEFVSDDNSHPNIKEIHSELQFLTKEMIKVGYNPDTSWVTRDVDSEEEKKELLCRHSEKLAMAWAMMNTTPGTTIRITKNLRVCGDCHTATKFISIVRKREIIVRDASRYHHFKDGKCSCGDYW